MSSETGFSAFARLILTAGGLFAGGVAISLRPNRPMFLILACLTCVLARYAFHPAWDSGRMLAGFGAIAAWLAAILMAVPQSYRRVGVSLLVLFHFGGIFAMATRPPEVNKSSWLGQSASAYIYRPYLQFLYLTDPYHYYTPDPGPSDLLWCCISYQNGECRWFKMPRNPEDRIDPAGLTYHRRLMLVVQLESYANDATISDEIKKRREARTAGERGILWHPQITMSDQYRPPSESVRLFLLPSYARHIARLKENQHEDGAIPIVSIKLYRVEHRVLAPELFGRNDPFSPATYLPFYLGEYDADGNPTHADDAMLGWLVPIYYYPARKDVSASHNPLDNPNDFILYDGLRNHTGTDHSSR